MNVTPFGIWGAYPKCAGEGTSAYLFQDHGCNMMLDFGSSALGKLLTVMLPEQLDAIVLTHLHYDHMLDLLPLQYYMQLNCPDKKIDIYLPAHSDPIVSLLSDCPNMQLHVVQHMSEIEIRNCKLTFMAMRHPVPTNGVKIQCGKRAFCYTGDTADNMNLPKLIKGCDFVLGDCSVLAASQLPNSPHIFVEQLAKYCKDLHATLLMTHFMTDQLQQVLAAGNAQGATCILVQEQKKYTV